MIIINPITFAEIRIDETKLTSEQAEILKRVHRLTRRIIKLQGQQWMEVFKMEADTQMRFSDILNKLKM